MKSWRHIYVPKGVFTSPTGGMKDDLMFEDRDVAAGNRKYATISKGRQNHCAMWLAEWVEESIIWTRSRNAKVKENASLICQFQPLDD
jgi:hypothetical protein